MRKFFLFFWILIGFLLLFYWIYLPALSKYRDLRVKEDQMQKKIDELNRKIVVLTEERNRLLNDPEYVERVIRNELGLVKSGEVVYKFVPEEVEKEKVGSSSSTVLGDPVVPFPSAEDS